MDALDRFAEIVCEEDFPLADAFLAFARAENPSMDTDAYLERIHELGLEAAALLGDAEDAGTRLKAFGEFLVGRGFRGNVEDYYEPSNSFLNEVLDTGAGIPITLSVVWIEVGRWAGLDLYGAAMPMHFLVGLAGEGLYADPFDGGRVLSPEDAMLVFARRTAGRLPWNDSYLDPAPPRHIVRRALVNLKGVFSATGRLSSALWVSDFLLALPETPASEHRDRASVLTAMGRWRDAIADLKEYLVNEPSDAELAEAEIRRLQAAMN